MPPHGGDLVDGSGTGKVRSAVSSRINYLALVNLKPGPMQDVRIRKAAREQLRHDVDQTQCTVRQSGQGPAR